MSDNTVAFKKDRSDQKSRAPINAPQTSTEVSEQLADFDKEITSTLSHLNALIENRNAWADGIEGCREAAVLLKSMQNRLRVTFETANKVEGSLASATAEISQWEKMYSELTLVEKDLRAERDRLRESASRQAIVENELRTEFEKRQATLDKQASSLTNARALVQELVREIS